MIFEALMFAVQLGIVVGGLRLLGFRVVIVEVKRDQDQQSR